MRPIALALELPPELVAELRREARDEAVRVVREELAKVPPLPAPPAAPEVRFMRIGAYAKRVGLGRRKVHEFIALGMPTHGRGRLRRVDVEKADAWLASYTAGTRTPTKEAS